MKSSSGSHLAFLVSLLVVVAAGAGIYFYYLHPTPCAKPIAYSIGHFDTQFGLSREEFLSVIEEGSSVWEKALGKDLFMPREDGKLVINLIYDDRQAETQEQQSLEEQIDTYELTYQQKRTLLDSLQREYENAAAEYAALLQVFKNASTAYQTEVMSWNRKGGAPKSEFERLSGLKQNLLVLQQQLESRRVALNGFAQSVNVLIEEVNTLAQETNSRVREYNQSDLIGVTFDQGLYVHSADGESINIYQFKDRQKLVRVLAHEFGHALGLDHNQNPESIMYELNREDTERLSADDIIALRTLCKDALTP